MSASLVGSEMCIRDRLRLLHRALLLPAALLAEPRGRLRVRQLLAVDLEVALVLRLVEVADALAGEE
eukprot:11042336-Alexandrium_andersonii.AAC.1